MISAAASLRLAESWLPRLGAHVWSSTIFLLLVIGALLLVRGRLTASARFAVALTGIAKFAIPSAAIAPWVRQWFRSKADDPLMLPLQIVGGAFPAVGSPSVPRLWPAVLITLWAAVAVVLIARHALVRHRLVALAVRTAMPASARESEALTRARRRLGIRTSIDVVRTQLPEAPAVLRVLRPLVVLPQSGCDDLSDEELESLLAHECAHVARHDNFIARIESFICALFWFHPLIWIAQQITVFERERACDEVVADSADGRDAYLSALRKFCHAAIAPRLPGVSCMATARLKERIDHVMRYPTLKAHTPSTGRLAFLSAAALVAFTMASSIVGSNQLFASSSERYSVRASAMRLQRSLLLQVVIEDNETQGVISAPRVTLTLPPALRSSDAGARMASMNSSAAGVDIAVQTRPDGDNQIVDVTIQKDGQTIQQNTLRVIPTVDETAHDAKRFTGHPISMDLKDADIRDVIRTFGKLTGLTMQIDDSVQGKVTVTWQNVPWDKAFDSLLSENGLTYTIDGKTVHVSKK